MGAKREAIAGMVRGLPDNEENYRSMARAANPHGDVRAARRIVAARPGRQSRRRLPSQ